MYFVVNAKRRELHFQRRWIQTGDRSKVGTFIMSD